MVKISVWSGRRIALWFGRSTSRLRRRTHSPEMLTDSAQVESQVQSLSSLIVLLLAAVGLLILWATSPQARSNPVIQQIFPLGETPLAQDASESAASQPTVASSAFTGGTVVFSMLVGAQEDLYALTAGRSEPVRLTDHPSDDRDPAWSPDGQHIAFTSRRDGNWELYLLDMHTGEISRLTHDLSFEAAPTWSPDGQWLAYEGYYENNLDIYLIKADGSEGPYRVTHHPAPDFSPAWVTTPLGREVAYVSWREGNQDIYIISLDDPSEERATNITKTPAVNEDAPAWGPMGTLLAYSAVENGTSVVYAVAIDQADGGVTGDPFLIGQGHSPAWSDDGVNLVFLSDRLEGSLLLTGQFGSWSTSVQAFALSATASDPDWSAGSLPAVLQGSLAFAATAPVTPAYEEALSYPPQRADDPYRPVVLPGVIAEAAWLNDRVDGSFIALKEYVNRESGWDFLGRLDQVFWALSRPVDPGQDYRNWHKAGRAFDIVQSYNQGTPAQIELVPEQVGPEFYWRLYVRCAVQDGSLGEPLRRLPWDFAARIGGDVEAYEKGGRFKEDIPSGYYLDFTRAASIFGWYRAPSDSSWRYNWPGVLYWQYEKRDGLDWWTAMLELYSEVDLGQAFYTPTSAPPSTEALTPTQQPTKEQTTPTPTPSQTPPAQ